MATVQRFEDLLCWQKSRELVREIYREFKSLKRHDAGLCDQIQRAAVSVMSNIAEGFESGTKQEFLNYLYIAKASAGEVRAQLYAAHDIGYLNVEVFKNLKNLAEECSRLIAHFIAGLKQSRFSGLQNKKVSRADEFKQWLEGEKRRLGIKYPYEARAEEEERRRREEEERQQGENRPNV